MDEMYVTGHTQTNSEWVTTASTPSEEGKDENACAPVARARSPRERYVSSRHTAQGDTPNLSTDR